MLDFKNFFCFFCDLEIILEFTSNLVYYYYYYQPMNVRRFYLRCIQYGACGTAYGTRHEVVHELRLWALQKFDKTHLDRVSGGVKHNTDIGFWK